MGRIVLPRHATPFHLTLALDPRDGRQASQLAAALVRAIADGQLHDGDPLPSTRSLARHLGLARSAVVAAYEELSAAGFLVATAGSATRVGPGARSASLAGAYTHPTEAEPQSAGAEGTAHPIRLDLRPGHPDPGLIDDRDWARAWRRAAAAPLQPPADAVTALRPGFGHSFHEPLRRALAEHLRRNRAVVCDAADVFLFPGVNAALRALVGLVGEPDRAIAFEEPGYSTGRRALESSGARVRPVPVDAEGLRVDDLGDEWGCYVTPAHQYPLGSRMSVARRAALLDWATAHDALILEDDYDGEFRYDVAPMPSLHSMNAGAERVIYLGTASKMLARELRVAWVVLPRRLREPMQDFLARTGDSVNPVAAAALAEFVDSGALVRQLARAQRGYAARRSRFTEACRDLLPGLVLQGIEAGLHVVLRLPAGIDDRALRDRLLVDGLACQALSDYWLGDPGAGESRSGGLVCGYARLPETRAREAAALIAAALARIQAEPGAPPA
ncbi:GntR family transcriptional regulator [Enemella evansiae]|nr:GntR family transcriptional regulator [Enemella evansiae]